MLAGTIVGAKLLLSSRSTSLPPALWVGSIPILSGKKNKTFLIVANRVGGQSPLVSAYKERYAQ